MTTLRRPVSVRAEPVEVRPALTSAARPFDAALRTGFAKLTPSVSIVAGSAGAGDNQIDIRGLNGARGAGSPVALIAALDPITRSMPSCSTAKRTELGFTFQDDGR